VKLGRSRFGASSGRYLFFRTVHAAGDRGAYRGSAASLCQQRPENVREKAAMRAHELRRARVQLSFAKLARHPRMVER